MEDTVDSSELAARNYMEQQETSTLMATELKPTEWTNQKHCLYLKSMETTFVDQLYKSIDMSGWHSHKNSLSGSKPSKHKLNSVRASSGQFKVLRYGCWSKLDFREDEPEVDEQEESNVPLTNPWIEHYRNSRTHSFRKFPVSSKLAPSVATEDQNPAHNFQLWHQDSVDSNTEGTGQNFDDEALEEDNSRRIHDTEKTRITTDIVSGIDQVVPLDNILQVDNDVEDPED